MTTLRAHGERLQHSHAFCKHVLRRHGCSKTTVAIADAPVSRTAHGQVVPTLTTNNACI